MISKYEQKWRDKIGETESGKIALVLWDIHMKRIEPTKRFGKEYKVEFVFDEHNKGLHISEDTFCWVIFRTMYPDQVRDFFKVIPITLMDCADIDAIVDTLNLQPWSCL